MAVLPVYRTQGNIHVENARGSRIEDRSGEMIGNAVANLGRAVQEVSAQWQKVQNAEVKLDAQNKLYKATSAIMEEAQNQPYTNEKDMNAKRKNFHERIGKAMNEIVGGIDNERNAADFMRESQISLMNTDARIDAIFRKKHIDHEAAALLQNEKDNHDQYILTGVGTFKDNFKNTLKTQKEAGYISEETYQKKVMGIDNWDKDRVFYIASTDPQVALDGVNADQFNINPTEKNDVLRTLNKMKTNKALSDAFQRELNYSENEANLQNYLFSDASFADKRQMIDKMALMGEISDNYASKARTFMTNFNPKHGLIVSNPKIASGLLQRVADLNKNTANATDYLRGYNNIRADALEAFNNGELSAKDFQAFNNQLSVYSRGNVATNTQVVARRYKEVNDYLKNSLPTDLRNQAFLEIWQEMDQIEMQGDKNETELKKMWREKSVEVTTRLATDRRLKATEAYANATNKSDSQFINELAKHRGTTPERTEKDIQDTMFLYGLTRQQVLNALKGNL